MMENHIYNLMKAVVKKGQAIWRYDKYKADSTDCASCQEIWKKIHADDEAHLKLLQDHLMEHLKR